MRRRWSTWSCRATSTGGRAMRSRSFPEHAAVVLAAAVEAIWSRRPGRGAHGSLGAPADRLRLGHRACRRPAGTALRRGRGPREARAPACHGAHPDGRRGAARRRPRLGASVSAVADRARRRLLGRTGRPGPLPGQRAAVAGDGRTTCSARIRSALRHPRACRACRGRCRDGLRGCSSLRWSSGGSSSRSCAIRR